MTVRAARGVVGIAGIALQLTQISDYEMLGQTIYVHAPNFKRSGRVLLGFTTALLSPQPPPQCHPHARVAYGMHVINFIH